MNQVFSKCSILELFLGFLTGVVWLLLSVLGVVTGFVGLLALGAIGTVLNIVIAIIGFLATLLFGVCIFKRVWRCCFGRGHGC